LGAWLGLMLPAVVAVWCWMNRQRRPVAVLAVCFFVFGCLPNLGWTRFMFQYYSTVADHYLYPSMLGVALAFALLVQWAIGPLSEPSLSPLPGVPQQGKRAQLATVATVLVLSSWGMISFRQAGFWADDTALFEHAMAINSNNFLAQNNYGVVLMQQENDPLSAMPHFRRSIELRPTHFNAWRNLAIAEAKLNRPADAIADIRRAMELELKYPADLRPTAQDQQFLDQELAKLNKPTPATTRATTTQGA
jgi:tetratricopeptide (TPR) repeat protein